MGMLNDQVSSLKVWKEGGVPGYGGEECWVAVFEHDLSWDAGWHAVFHEGDHHSGEFTNAGAHHDSVSAMQVRGKDCYVTLFEHDFTGWAAGPYGEGDYDTGKLMELGFQNDQTSSLKVWKQGVPEYGGEHCWVAIYEHHFDGWQIVFGEGSFNCAEFIGSGAQHD